MLSSIELLRNQNFVLYSILKLIRLVILTKCLDVLHLSETGEKYTSDYSVLWVSLIWKLTCVRLVGLPESNFYFNFINGTCTSRNWLINFYNSFGFIFFKSDLNRLSDYHNIKNWSSICVSLISSHINLSPRIATSFG